MHVAVRKTVVEWLLSADQAPHISIYVTGHSVGGALATHCAMDLKVCVCAHVSVFFCKQSIYIGK